MAIELSCPCGRQLRIADKFAGKTIRCPECSDPLTVPGRKKLAPSAPPTVKTIRFNCGCGKSMQTTEDNIGEVVSCPECGEDVLVPRKSVSPNRRVPVAAKSSASLRRTWPAKEPTRRGWLALGLLVLVGAIGASVAAWYAHRDDPQPDTALIPTNATMITSYRVADLWKGPVGKAIEQSGSAKVRIFLDGVARSANLTPEKIERATLVALDYHDDPDWAIVKTTEPYDRAKVEATFGRMLALPATRLEHEGESFIGTTSNVQPALWCSSDTVFVLGRRENVERCIRYSKRTQPVGPMTDIIREIRERKHPFITSVVPPKEYAKTRASTRGSKGSESEEEAWNRKKTRRITMVWTIDSKFRLRTIVDADHELTARRMSRSSKASYAKLSDIQQTGVIPWEEVKFGLEGTKVSVERIFSLDSLKATVLFEMRSQEHLIPDLGSLTEKNLGRLARAMLEYASANQGLFPKHSLKGVGRAPLLSWRVELLPYLGESDLYDAIRKDEPWDSDHNKQFWNRMPAVFAADGQDAKQGQTYFRVFTGPGSAFETNKDVGPRQIIDGSDTLLIAEAADSVPWMKPDELGFLALPWGFPATRLGGHEGDFFFAATANGSVLRVPRTVSGRSLMAAITIAGRDFPGPDFPRSNAGDMPIFPVQPPGGGRPIRPEIQGIPDN